MLSVKFAGLALVALSHVPLKPTPAIVPPAGTAALKETLVTVTSGPL